MSDPLLLTAAETAALLHVSCDTVERSIKVGLIPSKKIRTSIRVSREWVTAFCAELAPILFTRRQVSVTLGISMTYVRTLQIKGLLPTVKIGKAQRIPAAAACKLL
jgi:excisionase family DNA binding protein